MKPSTRSSAVIIVLFGSGLTIGTIAVYREAQRIKREQQTRRASRSELGAEMVWIPGGKFTMGGPDGQPDELPLHDVRVAGFWMDRTEVTNGQFARFVEATGYQTTAEKKPDAKDFPGAPEEKLVPGSVCFVPLPNVVSLNCLL